MIITLSAAVTLVLVLRFVVLLTSLNFCSGLNSKIHHTLHESVTTRN